MAPLLWIYDALLPLFGITLSFAFSGVLLTKRNVCTALVLYLFCALSQLALFLCFGEETVWRVYPAVTHLPAVLTLCLVCRRRPAAALASVATAYLLCQPSRWFGILAYALTKNPLVQEITRLVSLLLVGTVCVIWLSGMISHIFSGESHGIYLLGGLPMVYYLYDYATGVYGDLWIADSRITAEFMSFFLCVVYVCFCLVYYREYVQRADAERNEQMIRFTAEQQVHEMEAILRSERETRILRHDMRLFLSNLLLCMDEDPETARKMILSYSNVVENAAVRHYCENTVINCVLSNFADRCSEAGVSFQANVSFASLTVDEIMLASVLSNALDNALNAQKALPQEKRSIHLLLKDSNGRLLLSVRNPFSQLPQFVDGIPVSPRKGHGYGTQSIFLLTERMGGKCQFSVENDMFILRIIL